MKKIFYVLIISFISSLIYSMALANLPKANHNEFWNYITKVNPYKKWKQWPDHQGMINGRAPHGPFHIVYVNDIALSSAKAPVKYGSIQVKENFNRAKKLVAITAMYKVKGYNPKDGDWYWVKYNKFGKAGPYGKPDGCIGCHGTRANNDFILVHEFK